MLNEPASKTNAREVPEEDIPQVPPSYEALAKILSRNELSSGMYEFDEAALRFIRSYVEFESFDTTAFVGIIMPIITSVLLVTVNALDVMPEEIPQFGIAICLIISFLALILRNANRNENPMSEEFLKARPAMQILLERNHALLGDLQPEELTTLEIAAFFERIRHAISEI